MTYATGEEARRACVRLGIRFCPRCPNFGGIEEVRGSVYIACNLNPRFSVIGIREAARCTPERRTFALRVLGAVNNAI